MARYSPSGRRVTGDAGGAQMAPHLVGLNLIHGHAREVLYDLLQKMGVSDEGGSDPECDSGVADP
jgi:hypothetical protein